MAVSPPLTVVGGVVLASCDVHKWVSRRAILYHVLLIVIFPGCLIAGWWQVNRAEQGNTLSYAYSVEWPVFAIIAVIGWWQLIHEDDSEVEARKEERRKRAKNKGIPTIPEFTLADLEALSRPRTPELGPIGSTSLGEGDVGVFVPESEADRLAAEAAAAEATSGLSAYNAYLATLKERGHAKTWRNPKGL
jgi:DNA-binding transcriptional regulator of glucitol operon